MTRTLLAALLFLGICAHTFGQTITLSVDANCNTMVLLGKKRLTSADSTYSIPLSSTGSLRLRLVNPAKKDIFLNVKGANQDDNNSLALTPDFFSVNGFLPTDDNLVLTAGGKSIDLKKPFNIEIGCKDRAARNLVSSFNFQTVPATAPIAGLGGTSIPGAAGTTILLVPSTAALTAAPAADPVYHPGSAVYDALKLTNGKNLTREDLYAILKVYYPETTPITSDAQAVAAVSTNPYLKKYITSAFVAGLSSSPKAVAESTGDIFSNLSFSSIGGLDVTSFADGLAKFLVKRTKEELSIAYFTKFKEFLDKYPDIKTVFPQTYIVLGKIGDEIYNYSLYIQQLREAFKDDIQHLADNFPGIVDNHQAFFERQHSIAAALKTACYLAGDLQKQVHPGDILAGFPLEYLNSESKNISGSIQTLQLLSASMRDTTAADSTYWVNLKYLRQLVGNQQSFILYLGLVYQMAQSPQYANIPFEKTTLADFLNKTAPEIIKGLDIYNQYKLYILRFAEKTDNLNRMIKSYSKPANDSLAIELYKKYFDGFLDYVKYAAQVGKLPGADKVPFLANLSTELAPYFDLATSVSNLVTDINRKNYPSAINNAVSIYTTIRSLPAKAEAEAALKAAPPKTASLKKVKAGSMNAVDSTAAVAAIQLTSEADSISTTTSSFMKYGAFMASVATAKNSDDVAAAIEAAVLPSGSARVKRESAFNISLNAYTGLFLGHEVIKGVKDARTFNAFGVTAPIGVALSKGHSFFFFNTGKHGWSTSLFLSVIDIGAIASYRFSNDTTAQVPTIELKNILSPGAFISIGIPKSPLSLNFGAQTGPNLRKIDNNSTQPSNDSNNKFYWRFSASICVDIPLLNFYTKSK